MTEDELQNAVIEFADLHEWRVAHLFPAQTATAAISADATHWPDLVLIRERIVFAELTMDSRERSVEESGWRGASIAAGAEHYVWRPKDWQDGTIECLLV